MNDIRRLLQSQPKRAKIVSDRLSNSPTLGNPSTSEAFDINGAPVLHNLQSHSPALIEDDVPEYILNAESADEEEVS